MIFEYRQIMVAPTRAMIFLVVKLQQMLCWSSSFIIVTSSSWEFSA